ncbi:MAG: helix-turn-helix domain-containing protein [Planctomycetota bacterium]
MRGTKAFGEAFRARRRELGLTLREFCRRSGLDPGNVSRLERGRLAPPADRAKLEEYARHLGFEEESEGWTEFLDLGQVCAGAIPDEVMGNEALVKKLPLVFRTCSGRAPTRKQIERLVEILRSE